MNTGMLWFDQNPKTSLKDKILLAANYYRRKYDRAPQLCLISPKTQAENPDVKSVPFEGGEITVRAWSGTLSHHFWLGFEDVPAPVETTR